MSELALTTLEHRRDQMVQRSTILLAAASGIILVTFQFILRAEPAPQRLVTLSLAFAAVALASVAMLQSLNIIRRLRKRTRGRFRTHMLFFGWIALHTPNDLRKRFASLTDEDYLLEVSTQCVSLSRNLKERYTALRRSYRSFTMALIVFLVALGSYESEILYPSRGCGAVHAGARSLLTITTWWR